MTDDQPPIQDARVVEDAGEDPNIRETEYNTNATGGASPSGAEMLARALSLGRLGLRVFPVDREKKKPAIVGWQKRATSDPDAIKRLWTSALNESENHNIGVLTGELLPNGNRLLVVDLDPKGRKATARTEGYSSVGVSIRYDALTKAIGENLPPTLTVRTPSRGLHLYFQHSANLEFKSTPGILRGVDIRARGALVVAPGSVKTDGGYAFEHGHGPDDAEIAIAPAALLSFLEAAPPKRERREGPAPLCDLDTPEAAEWYRRWLRDEAPASVEGEAGRRDLMCVIQKGFDVALSPDRVFEILTEGGGWNETKADPPWEVSIDDGDGFRRLIDDLWSGHRERPAGYDFWRLVRQTVMPAELAFEAIEMTEVMKPRNDNAAPGAGQASSRPRIFFGPDLADAVRAKKHEALIEDLIDTGSFVLLYGQPKQGKTHVAVSIAAHLATGEMWGGRKVKRGLSVYLAGEGGDDIKRRALAVTEGRPPAEAPFALIPGRFSLMTAAGVDRISRDIEAAAELSGFDPVAFFPDTLSRGFDGRDENSSSDMGLFINSVDKIRDRTGAAAIILHHQIKNATMEDGGRGHGALRGAYDTALHIGDQKISIFEQRALPPGPPIRFRFLDRQVGPDSEDKMIRTAVAEINPTAFTEPVALTPVLRQAFDIFAALATADAEGAVLGAEWNARMKAAREALSKKSAERANAVRMAERAYPAGLDRGRWRRPMAAGRMNRKTVLDNPLRSRTNRRIVHPNSIRRKRANHTFEGPTSDSSGRVRIRGLSRRRPHFQGFPRGVRRVRRGFGFNLSNLATEFGSHSPPLRGECPNKPDRPNSQIPNPEKRN